jgi:malate synthase
MIRVDFENFENSSLTPSLVTDAATYMLSQQSLYSSIGHTSFRRFGTKKTRNNQEQLLN